MNSKNKLRFEEQVQSYLSGTLNQREIDELWAEAIEDGEKLNYIKTVANISAINNEYAGQYNEDKNGSSFHVLHPKHYAAAAVISVLIGVLSFILLPFSNNSSSDIQLNPLETVSIDYYRSSGNVNPADEIISEAVEKYNSGNTGQAVSLLKNNISDSEYNLESKYALKIQLGKVYYNEGKFGEAKAVFNDIVSSSKAFNVKEQAMWLLANSYLKSSKIDSENAVDVLKKIKVMKGAHSRMAESMLENIE